MGTAMALWGLYLGASNFSDNDVAFAMGVGAAMIVLGAFAIPWKASKESPTEAIEWLERLRAL